MRVSVCVRTSKIKRERGRGREGDMGERGRDREGWKKEIKRERERERMENQKIREIRFLDAFMLTERKDWFD